MQHGDAAMIGLPTTALLEDAPVGHLLSLQCVEVCVLLQHVCDAAAALLRHIAAGRKKTFNKKLRLHLMQRQRQGRTDTRCSPTRLHVSSGINDGRLAI